MTRALILALVLLIGTAGPSVAPIVKEDDPAKDAARKRFYEQMWPDNPYGARFLAQICGIPEQSQYCLGYLQAVYDSLAGEDATVRTKYCQPLEYYRSIEARRLTFSKLLSEVVDSSGRSLYSMYEMGLLALRWKRCLQMR